MINLNLDQLRTFVAACEKGSFSAVARDMGRAQSAVSTQIQNLELDLGLTLFDRSGKYPQPTAEAQALLPLARQAIGQLRRFLQAADSYQSGEEPLLRIVFEELVMPDKLNDMLAAFAECFPHTQIRASTASDECAIGRIAEGDADFAFVTNRDHYPDEVDFNNLGQQRVLTLACPEHPLAQKPGSSLNEAAQYRQLVAASPSSRRRWQLSPQTWSSDSLLQALDLACKGVGWVNAPYELARPFLKSGKLVELNLSNALSAWSLGVDLLWSAKTPQGTAARWFAREARRLYGNYYSPPIETTDRI
ncbi:LysR family transcriptional regulator [Microbulbifer taiwanensis]|uniref:LysR family transcriptional regulator n=1 Tax=Microbulbifer taiwanensis TaxID=986746 RepID=A0ABW1YRB8_9GAMM|nr:LysR family transcriptional regulator [Microbulbifer taiwanensis]